MVKHIISNGPEFFDERGADGNVRKVVRVSGHVKFTRYHHDSFIEPQTKYYKENVRGEIVELTGRRRTAVLSAWCEKKGIEYGGFTKPQLRRMMAEYAKDPENKVITRKCGERNYAIAEIVGVSVCDDETYDRETGIKLAVEDFHRKCAKTAWAKINSVMKKWSDEMRKIYNENTARHYEAMNSSLKRADHVDRLVNKESVLVIHPDDPTTVPLKKVYEGKDWMVIDNPYSSPEYIAHEIDAHSTIIIMGHGTPYGLLGPMGHMVDVNMAPLLKGKNVIGVWCNADQYFAKTGIEGFKTGMIVSEVAEAAMINAEISEEECLRQFDKFCEALKKGVEAGMNDHKELEKVLLENYHEDAGDSDALRAVYAYNRSNCVNEHVEDAGYDELIAE